MGVRSVCVCVCVCGWGVCAVEREKGGQAGVHEGDGVCVPGLVLEINASSGGCTRGRLEDEKAERWGGREAGSDYEEKSGRGEG